MKTAGSTCCPVERREAGHGGHPASRMCTHVGARAQLPRGAWRLSNELAHLRIACSAAVQGMQYSADAVQMQCRCITGAVHT